jgi:hypothetical protein
MIAGSSAGCGTEDTGFVAARRWERADPTGGYCFSPSITAMQEVLASQIRRCVLFANGAFR